MEMYDKEGYVIAFQSEEEEGYAKFFQEHGFVVIRDVLTSMPSDIYKSIGTNLNNRKGNRRDNKRNMDT